MNKMIKEENLKNKANEKAERRKLNHQINHIYLVMPWAVYDD